MDSHTSDLWQQILSIIQNKLSKPSFDTWFKATKATKLNDRSIVISAPTTFAVEWLESRYTKLVGSTVYELLGKQVDVKFVIEENKPVEPDPQLPAATPTVVQEEAVLSTLESKIYVRYNLSLAAATVLPTPHRWRSAEAPAKAYNPLFLYGGVGLGKTHLMHAIGHYVLEYDPGSNSRLLILSSEKFTNEFINSIRDNRGESFR